MTLSLGIIGSSKGNGHPYSWSAIFNGYDADAMSECEYPVIPEYLSKQNWPSARIFDANVVSIWTQDYELSKHIAKASCIPHVSLSLNELIDNVDAVLLARDDAENHMYFSKNILLSGKPIYIDKPIALSKANLNEIYQLQQYSGQIFTCSALRYSSELSLSHQDKIDLGEITKISAFTPNSWEKYAVHLIEPILNMINPENKIVGSELVINSFEAKTLNVTWKNGLKTFINTLGRSNVPIKIEIEGLNGTKSLIFKDAFLSFKCALQDYVDGINKNECRSPFEFNSRVVDLIERGIT